MRNSPPGRPIVATGATAGSPGTRSLTFGNLPLATSAAKRAVSSIAAGALPTNSSNIASATGPHLVCRVPTGSAGPIALGAKPASGAGATIAARHSFDRPAPRLDQMVRRHLDQPRRGI